jgi:hypothetical protein
MTMERFRSSRRSTTPKGEVEPIQGILGRRPTVSKRVRWLDGSGLMVFVVVCLSVRQGERQRVVEGPVKRRWTTEGVRASGSSVSALPASMGAEGRRHGRNPESRRLFGGEAVAAKSRFISG